MRFSLLGSQPGPSGSDSISRLENDQVQLPPQIPLSQPDAESSKRPPIPKVAVVVAGAAFALTAGLTILIFPFVRQAAKLSNPTQFIAHKHSSRPLRTPRPRVPTTPSPQLASPAVSTSPPLSQVSEAIDSQIWTSRAFNDREEDQLWGRPQLDEQGEELPPVSPLMGVQALGIATAIVLGTAGLGAWGVSRLLGVDDMTEFNIKVRGMLAESMPELVENVNRKEEGDEIIVPDGVVEEDDINEAALDKWINSFRQNKQ